MQVKTILTSSLLLISLTNPLAAQTIAPDDPDPATRTIETIIERTQKEVDLKTIEEALAKAEEARRKLEAEVKSIETDRAKLNAALLDTTRQLQATELQARELETRLTNLAGRETAIRRSLEGRRGLIMEVLATLQRMGRRPPPAVVVAPEDILEAVRASIMLGFVVPELKMEAEILANDLQELTHLQQAIAQDRETLKKTYADLKNEQVRISALTEARQRQLGDAERAFSTEKDRVAALSQQARGIKELIDRLDKETAFVQRNAEAAHRAAEAKARETREKFASAAFRDPARLAPQMPFGEARGLLPLPASGEIVRSYGDADGVGGTSRGITIATRSKGVVASPADGWVSFAGPFRSFGKLLIINVGGGYYVLLAGMDRINVDIGQFVLAGEPVAVMGETNSVTPASGGSETRGPGLYVEFRKDGGPIDPGPWWSRQKVEKVRG